MCRETGRTEALRRDGYQEIYRFNIVVGVIIPGIANRALSRAYSTSGPMGPPPLSATTGMPYSQWAASKVKQFILALFIYRC